MAKIKNLFVGCPVVVKGLDDDGPRIIVFIDTDEKSICVLSLVSQHHTWYEPDELKLIPFPDPEKVLAHFERFENV